MRLILTNFLSKELLYEVFILYGADTFASSPLITEPRINCRRTLKLTLTFRSHKTN